jgi:hypothetical protein
MLRYTAVRVATVLVITCGCLRPAQAAAQTSAKPRPQATASTALTAAEVNKQIVGHSVALTDGGMTWYFNPGGKYDGDDGRNSRGGRYEVRPDGRLCWTEQNGTSGCFRYYRQAGSIRVRRADPGHDTDLGSAKVGPL